MASPVFACAGGNGADRTQELAKLVRQRLLPVPDTDQA
ncbi:hypothetical protein VD0004_g3993 [Verticillium dahliae]|nr:hypothetical protein VD0004_g3993 [Verticillium dahliae]PNH72407.1 hypothetical protein VD0001_g5145 [Verticillium dahliae]